MTMKYLVKIKVCCGPFMWTKVLLTARDQMAGIGASVAWSLHLNHTGFTIKYNNYYSVHL